MATHNLVQRNGEAGDTGERDDGVGPVQPAAIQPAAGRQGGQDRACDCRASALSMATSCATARKPDSFVVSRHAYLH
jgi:hypothetical protein